MTIVFVLIIATIGLLSNVRYVRSHWDEYRCQPEIMPLASLYGYNTQENFEFCLGKTFQTHASPYFGSMATMFGSFSSILTTLLGSANSLRLGIATLGGGINVLTQDFFDRISQFFFQIRVSAIRIRTLMTRLYATMFATMFLATSAITGVTSFTNTSLFSFIDTFCWDPATVVEVEGRGAIRIADIAIGDVVAEAGVRARVTAKFEFDVQEQPMVRLPRRGGGRGGRDRADILVSTNHYVLDGHRWKKAGEHTWAHTARPWTGRLVCVNTDTHVVPIGGYYFRDYDETGAVDRPAMAAVEGRLNGWGAGGAGGAALTAATDYGSCLAEGTHVLTRDGQSIPVEALAIGTILSTGSIVVGRVVRECAECVRLDCGCRMSSSVALWRGEKWTRAADVCAGGVETAQPTRMYGVFALPSCQLEIACLSSSADSHRVRDYMEVCDPSANKLYDEELATL